MRCNVKILGKIPSIRHENATTITKTQKRNQKRNIFYVITIYVKKTTIYAILSNYNFYTI